LTGGEGVVSKNVHPPSRVAKLVDSPNLPEGEAMFYVETAGIRDV